MKENTEKQRFEETENGKLVFADYRIRDGHYALVHVEADPELRGTGAAPRLMEAIAAHARANGLKLQPRCSYAVAWFRRHPEAKDLIAT
jgi:predicted GNAT family acetyltransferase